MAPGRVVDERVDTIPERVAGVKDVGVRESDGDVAVGVSRPVLLQRDPRLRTIGYCGEVLRPRPDPLSAPARFLGNAVRWWSSAC